MVANDALFSGEVRNLTNRAHIQESSEQVHQILMEYCHNCYPNVPVRQSSQTTSTHDSPALTAFFIIYFNNEHFRNKKESPSCAGLHTNSVIE